MVYMTMLTPTRKAYSRWPGTGGAIGSRERFCSSIAQAPAIETSPLTIFFAFAVTAVVLIVTIVVLLRAPIMVAKTGKAVTSKAAGSALPVVTRHQKLAPKKQKLLTAQLIKLAKMLLIVIPAILGLLMATIVTPPLPVDIMAFVLGILALGGLVNFSIQYLLARWLRIDSENLV